MSAEGQTDRILPLEGGHNFRDIGGYRTQDGRTVARRRVYRSGSMARLTDADQAAIAALDLKLICDLRTNRERRNLPSRLSESHTAERVSRDHEGSVGEMLAALSRAGATPEGTRQWMIDVYRKLPYEQSESYRELYGRIAAGQVPLVFHCAAGKDRAGVASAMLLEMLGVSRETIFEDYMLSDLFFGHNRAMVLSDPASHDYTELSPALWEPILHADRDYLAATYEVVEREHGSVSGYLSEVLEIDAPMVEAVRAALLE